MIITLEDSLDSFLTCGEAKYFHCSEEAIIFDDYYYLNEPEKHKKIESEKRINEQQDLILEQ
ncbi:MAG: hypothetical protein AAB509_02780 [Patescibacteria group bacterium]